MHYFYKGTNDKAIAAILENLTTHSYTYVYHGNGYFEVLLGSYTNRTQLEEGLTYWDHYFDENNLHAFAMPPVAPEGILSGLAERIELSDRIVYVENTME